MPINISFTETSQGRKLSKRRPRGTTTKTKVNNIDRVIGKDGGGDLKEFSSSGNRNSGNGVEMKKELEVEVEVENLVIGQGLTTNGNGNGKGFERVTGYDMFLTADPELLQCMADNREFYVGRKDKDTAVKGEIEGRG